VQGLAGNRRRGRRRRRREQWEREMGETAVNFFE
jgi:hypothetical protein